MPIILITFSYFTGFAGLLSFLNYLLSRYYDMNTHSSIFIVTGIIMLSLSIGLILSFKDSKVKLSPSNNLISIVVIWFFMPLVLMIPIYMLLDISMISSYFEAVSMLTTTGYSAFIDNKNMPISLILWYSILQWYGGFITILFAVSVINFYQEASVINTTYRRIADIKNIKLLHIIRRVIYLYASLTLVCFITLLTLGLSSFESIILALSSISTGGFIGHNILIIDNMVLLALSVFMIVGMINLYYTRELRLSNCICIVTHKYALFMYALFIIINYFDNQHYISLTDKIIKNAFSYISLITTTGYDVKNINSNSIPIIVMLTLVLIGGFYGSTSGGIKIDRLMEMIKLSFRELNLLIRPNLVYGEAVERDSKIASLYWAYFFIYIISFSIITLIISINDISFEQSFMLAAATITNSGNIILNNLDTNLLSQIDDRYKIFLSFSMILGRLEILALIGCLMAIVKK